jgi:hypothetical protein
MKDVGIFVSHSSKYVDIANSLKLSLHALEAETPLAIKISEDMAGATDWRQWIEENVRSADIFLLLFPHVNMDMGWCNYELGRFYDGKRKVVCIKNTDIPEPPPPFQPYQAYNADEAGIGKFIDELFVKGTFTGGEPINANVGQITQPLYERAQRVARELAQKFAQARVREQFYERRVVLSVHYKGTKEFDAEASTIQGNADGLALLGLGNVANVPWSTVRQTVGDKVRWPSQLEEALPFITEGALPPALSPFGADVIYIPVIARALSIDNVLGEVVLIFVAVDTKQLRPLLDWSTPKNMPDAFALLVQLVRMLSRARWEILESRYQEVKYHAPTPERCAEIARLVNEDYDQMGRNAENWGIHGIEQFYGVFAHDLRANATECSEEWLQFMNALRRAPVQNSDDLSRRLKDLLDNNAKWLELAAKQFTLTAAELR